MLSLSPSLSLSLSLSLSQSLSLSLNLNLDPALCLGRVAGKDDGGVGSAFPNPNFRSVLTFKSTFGQFGKIVTVLLNVNMDREEYEISTLKITARVHRIVNLKPKKRPLTFTFTVPEGAGKKRSVARACARAESALCGRGESAG